MNWVPWIRAGFMAVALAAWFWTQSLIGRQATPTGQIKDRVHEWLASWHGALSRRPAAANALLIISSLMIDALGIFVILYSILGPSIHPMIALLLIFSLRQICQTTTALPPPTGMIWRDPGVPTLLVTYGVSNDLFFSGHTAIAVLGSLLLGSFGSPVWIAAGILITVFEILVVLALRAHYTLDVFTGVVVALWIWTASQTPAQWLDQTFQTLLK